MKKLFYFSKQPNVNSCLYLTHALSNTYSFQLIHTTALLSKLSLEVNDPVNLLVVQHDSLEEYIQHVTNQQDLFPTMKQRCFIELQESSEPFSKFKIESLVMGKKAAYSPPGLKCFKKIQDIKPIDFDRDDYLYFLLYRDEDSLRYIYQNFSKSLFFPVLLKDKRWQDVLTDKRFKPIAEYKARIPHKFYFYHGVFSDEYLLESQMWRLNSIVILHQNLQDVVDQVEVHDRHQCIISIKHIYAAQIEERLKKLQSKNYTLKVRNMSKFTQIFKPPSKEVFYTKSITNTHQAFLYRQKFNEVSVCVHSNLPLDQFQHMNIPSSKIFSSDKFCNRKQAFFHIYKLEQGVIETVPSKHFILNPESKPIRTPVEFKTSNNLKELKCALWDEWARRRQLYQRLNIFVVQNNHIYNVILKDVNQSQFTVSYLKTAASLSVQNFRDSPSCIVLETPNIGLLQALKDIYCVVIVLYQKSKPVYFNQKHYLHFVEAAYAHQIHNCLKQNTTSLWLSFDCDLDWHRKKISWGKIICTSKDSKIVQLTDRINKHLELQSDYEHRQNLLLVQEKDVHKVLERLYDNDIMLVVSTVPSYWMNLYQRDKRMYIFSRSIRDMMRKVLDDMPFKSKRGLLLKQRRQLLLGSKLFNLINDDQFIKHIDTLYGQAFSITHLQQVSHLLAKSAKQSHIIILPEKWLPQLIDRPFAKLFVLDQDIIKGNFVYFMQEQVKIVTAKKHEIIGELAYYSPDWIKSKAKLYYKQRWVQDQPRA